MAENSKVEFIDDKEGNQFTVRISRKLAASEAVSSREQAVSSEQKILEFCVEPRSLTEICELWGRSNVTFRLFRSHLRGVPMILWGSKVSSERPQSDVPTGVRNVKNDP